MPEPAISFSNVSKRYGAAPVLRAVDLVVPRGAAFALAGENGAGKTTLIKCMLDFCHYESGDIRINGTTSRDASARSALAFLPERFTPPWFLTGRQFLESMRRLTGASWTPAEALQMLHDIGLDSAALDRSARDYSKGMNQKLGLAACFLSGREIYVLDEPMTGLDPSARYRVKSILKRLRSQGRTLLITTHALAEAEEICDHMAVLHGGAVAFSGSPMELRARYGEDSLERAFLKCIGEGEGGNV